MREINAINTKKHFVVTTLFPTENHEQITTTTGLQLCEAISLQTLCVKFYLNLGKLLFCGCRECLDSIQNLELK